MVFAALFYNDNVKQCPVFAFPAGRMTFKLHKLLLIHFFVSFGLALVQQDQTPTSDNTLPTSVFVLPLGNDSKNYTFALNLPTNSEDVYFRLSGPADYSWVAVGTGSKMKDSMMFLIYANAAGTGS